MPTVIVTGGTGLIGKRLTRMLVSKGYDVILFSHSQPAHTTASGVVVKHWNIHTGEIDRDAIGKADYLVHLAGAGVADKRWTAKRKQQIEESRTKSGELLVNSLRDIPNHIGAVITSSAIGWYGEDSAGSKAHGFAESEPPSNDFLGQTCRRWEESLEPVTALGKRLVKLRTGIVLSTRGGALAEFIKPLKAGVASILGSGNQVISWIHEEDICRMYLYAIENNHLTGAYNAVAPHPVTNKELVVRLAMAMQGMRWLPVWVPAVALRLALGELSIEVLKSATVSADKIVQNGFSFLYPDIKVALQQLVQH